MSIEIPSEFQPFVDHLVAQRKYLNANEVISAGLRMLQARELLNEEIQAGFAQIDAGQKIDGKTVFANARNRIQELESGKG